MKKRISQKLHSAAIMLCCLLLSPQFSKSQTIELPLQDLSFFKDPGKSWQIVGNITSELEKPNEFEIEDGTGILANYPKKKIAGTDLFTKSQYGDMDLELDYMMAKGSNSGIYFQGLYELQLKDSWGIQQLTSGENGGIYERWDENKPEAQKGYQGYPARQNVSKGPGLWQHLQVSFQAPRFDEKGQKTANAKFLFVKLNGITIQENVELFGPTRGAISNEEKPKGPLRIQGDHGAVAFRDINISSFENSKPALENLTYQVFTGNISPSTTIDSLTPEKEAALSVLTADIRTEANQFLVKYSGELAIKEPGTYTFQLNVAGGSGHLKINDKEVIPLGRWNLGGSIVLPKQSVPFELVYVKYENWGQPGIGLSVAGPGIREFLISDGNAKVENPVDPILVEANQNTILRSFVDLPYNDEAGGYRVTHSISVGSPRQVHYTYDLDYGTIVQLWRGKFLNTTPMWHSRGDGSSRPMGAVQYFGIPALALSRLASSNDKWPSDTTGSFYRPGGYQLDIHGSPTFFYSIYKADVQDAIVVMDGAEGIKRTITVNKPVRNLYALLAKGTKIEEKSNNLYLIDDKSYYLKLENSAEKPFVRNLNGVQELIAPIESKLVYSILF